MANSIFKELEKGSLTGLKRCISLFPSSVNARNSAGATPLHLASAQGLSAFVKDLLVHGAPHDITDGQGNLPLHLAAEQGSLETVTELLTGPGRKLVVKAKNRDGQTPLHLAVRNGHVAVVAKLLDVGARTDVKDKAGITPLELVSAEDEEMLQLLLDGTPTSALGSVSQGIGTSALARPLEVSHSSHRLAASGLLTPSVATSSASGRFATPPPVSVSGSGRMTAATPSTPPSRTAGHGAGVASARSSHAAPIAGTPGGATNRASGTGSGTPGRMSTRLPRNVSMGPTPTAAPAAAGGAAAASVPPAGAVAEAPLISAQLHKQDAAIQALRADLRTATERLGAVDACATAQLECAGQVEKALETCGSNSRALADLDVRVGFQEERSRDARSRLERLEEGERSLQASVARLTEDNRGLGTQLHRLADQVAVGSSAAANQQQPAFVSQAQTQVQSDLAVLRAQVDQLAPALMVATSASAEARALASRLESLQQQVQQQAAQQQQAPSPHSPLGGNLLLDQQVLQLQAQVQLLQLPVASVTQQCADLSIRLTGLTDWQQQARGELTRLGEAAAQAQANQDGSKGLGGELSDAVMRVLDTTARTMAELRAQQDDTAKQVLALQQQLNQQSQQQQAANAVPSTPPPAVQPGVPSTPPSMRHGSLGGLPSLGNMTRDTAAQAELRAELEALKSLVADVRKEVASEGGSLRREWQRAFSDMQSRYGEQTNELRSREQNIAKLREAMLVDEAERRAASEYEEKTAKRLSKLETGLEYLTHRLEVMEEQVSGLVSTLAGSCSPPVALSPAGMPPAGRMAFSKQGSRSAAQSGPGPVSENHSCVSSPTSRLTAAAAANLASSLMVAAPKGDGWSAGNVEPRAAACAPPVGQPTGSARGRSGGQTPSPFGGRGSRLRSGGGADAKRPAACPSQALQTDGGLAASSHEREEWWSAAVAVPAPGAVSISPLPRMQCIDRGAGTAAILAEGGVGCPDRMSVSAEAARAAGTAVDAAASGGLGPATGADPLNLTGPGLLQQQLQPPPPSAARIGVGLPRERVSGATVAATSPGPQHTGLPPAPQSPASAALRGIEPQAIDQLLLHTAGFGAVGFAAQDPASMSVGPQLLPAAAHALLLPTVDIQRLAAAAAAQQQMLQQGQQLQVHQGQVLATQRQQQMQLQVAGAQMLQHHQQQMQLQATGIMPAQGMVVHDGEAAGAKALGAAPPARSPSPIRGPSAASGNGGLASPPNGTRSAPPMCFFCPVQ